MTLPYRDVTIGTLLTRLAEALPEHDALLHAGGPRHTFAALEHEARVIARGLMAIGVAHGERVVIWATGGRPLGYGPRGLGRPGGPRRSICR